MRRGCREKRDDSPEWLPFQEGIVTSAEVATPPPPKDSQHLRYLNNNLMMWCTRLL